MHNMNEHCKRLYTLAYAHAYTVQWSDFLYILSPESLIYNKGRVVREVKKKNVEMFGIFGDDISLVLIRLWISNDMLNSPRDGNEKPICW